MAFWDDLARRNTGFSGYMGGVNPGGFQQTGEIQQAQPEPMTGEQNPLPPAVSVHNGQVVNTATGQPYESGQWQDPRRVGGQPLGLGSIWGHPYFQDVLRRGLQQQGINYTPGNGIPQRTGWAGSMMFPNPMPLGRMAGGAARGIGMLRFK